MIKRALIVDDSLTVRKQVGNALRNAGFETVEAIDGVDALAKVSSTNEARFDVVVCDVNMPNMDGIQFLEESSRQLKAPLAAIMLTTEAQPTMMDRARRAGAKGWLLKPFKAELLVAAAKKLCGP